MQLVLILFFVSLAGIALMIGRKLILSKTGVTPTEDNFLFEIPDHQDVKHIAVKNIRKYGYIFLVSTIRLYVRTINYLRRKSGELYNIIHRIVTWNKFEKSESHKEVSKFLKMMSEYKHKISKIKHKIVEEEKNQS